MASIFDLQDLSLLKTPPRIPVPATMPTIADTSKLSLNTQATPVNSDMAAYMSNLSNTLSKMNQPDPIAQALKSGYVQNLTTPTPSMGYSISNLPSTISSAYKAGGGGWGGAGLAALAGLGNIAGSSAAQGIYAGTMSNPWQAGAMANQSGASHQNEIALQNAQVQANMAKQQQIGELVKQSQAEQAAQSLKKNEALVNAPTQFADFRAKMIAPEIEKGRLNLETGKQQYAENVDPLIKNAQEMYNKGNLNEESYAKIVSNPYKFKISGSANKVMGVGVRAPVVEGILHQDANGHQAYVFPDGSIQEIK